MAFQAPRPESKRLSCCLPRAPQGGEAEAAAEGEGEGEGEEKEGVAAELEREEDKVADEEIAGEFCFE